MDLVSRISEKMIAMDEDYDELKPFMKEYLYKIEEIIRKKEEIQRQGIQTIKENVLSVSTISEVLGCSRTTLYNHNQLLKRYIEYSQQEFNRSNPYYKCDQYEIENKQLKEQVYLMVNRDINTEILKQENEYLKKQLKEAKQETKKLNERLIILMQKTRT